MTNQEATMQISRVEKYKELCTRRDKFNELLHLIQRSDPEGPCQQGPFTGNTRESRRVNAITINFSKTRGGAPSVDLWLQGLELEAHEFGSYLQSHLNKQIKNINDEIEAL